MSEVGNLFTMLRQSADPGAVSAIEELVRDAPDHALSRVNAVDFATKACLDQERAIAAFCMPRGSGFSSCRGTCCAPAAAACSIPARP